MDKRQTNKLAMYRAFLAVLANYPAITSTIKAFAARVALLTATIDDIVDLDAKQSQPLRGSITDRNKILAQMIGSTLTLCGTVLSHATTHGLDSLADKVRLTTADFARVRISRRVAVAQHALDAIREALPLLADAEVTEADLNALQALIDSATTMLSAPRKATVTKRAATERLSVVFRQANKIVEDQIDPLIAPLADSQPEFYARYRAAREVIDIPGPRRPGEEAAPAAPTASPQNGGATHA